MTKLCLMFFMLAIGASAQVVNPGGGGGGATIASTTGVIKGDGAGNGIAAVSGVDYAAATLGTVPYTGLVATRGLIPNAQLGTQTWTMNCTYHIARQALTANSIKVIWPNYSVPNTSGVETGAGPATFKASIEYPIGTGNGCPAGGTIAGTCTFSGVTQPTVASLADAIADFCPHAAIPNGAAFRIRMLYVNATGVLLVPAQTIISQSGNPREGNLFGTGTPNDLTGGGAVTNASSVMHTPGAIIATTSQPSVCIVGDSRAIGFLDVIQDANVGDVGEVAKWIGPNFAYTNLAVYGTTLNSALTNFTNRARLFQYCSHVVDEYGVNDIAGGRTVAQLAANRTSLAALAGKPTFGTTIPSETSSTDSWATTTNQTRIGNATVLDAFNVLERAGIAGELNFFDIANAVDPLALGVWPVSKILGTTSGTAGFATTDGIHETPLMYQIEAQQMAPYASWIMRK